MEDSDQSDWEDSQTPDAPPSDDGEPLPDEEEFAVAADELRPVHSDRPRTYTATSTATSTSTSTATATATATATPPWTQRPIMVSLDCPALSALEKAIAADIDTRVIYHLEQLLRAIARDEKMSYGRLAKRYLAPLLAAPVARPVARPVIHVTPRQSTHQHEQVS